MLDDNVTNGHILPQEASRVNDLNHTAEKHGGLDCPRQVKPSPLRQRVVVRAQQQAGDHVVNRHTYERKSTPRSISNALIAATSSGATTASPSPASGLNGAR